MKKTPWFKGSLKPARVGQYEVKCADWTFYGPIVFDGYEWRDSDGRQPLFHCCRWRGLQEPAKQPVIDGPEA